MSTTEQKVATETVAFFAGTTIPYDANSRRAVRAPICWPRQPAALADFLNAQFVDM